VYFPRVFWENMLDIRGIFVRCLKNEMLSRMDVLFSKHPSIRRGQITCLPIALKNLEYVFYV
jgi:hypothetical protein